MLVTVHLIGVPKNATVLGSVCGIVGSWGRGTGVRRYEYTCSTSDMQGRLEVVLGVTSGRENDRSSAAVVHELLLLPLCGAAVLAGLLQAVDLFPI